MNSLPEEEQDRSAMARLMAGHDAALNELMERHGEKLFHFLIRLLQDESEAADLAQEAFVRVYQNRAKFRVDSKFSTWLYTIASNLARDTLRYRARHPQVALDAQNESTGASLADLLPAKGPAPSETMQTAERVAAVQSALRDLPEQLRTPLVLCEYEELSQSEIAHVLGCTTKAVEDRIYRARKQLRVRLEEWLQG